MRDIAGKNVTTIGVLLTVSASYAQPLVVAVDLDASTPGVQDVIVVPRGTTVVRGVGVQVLDPTGTYRCAGIGYIGGIDRGLAFGHTPVERPGRSVIGLVSSVEATLNEPALAGGMGFLTPFVIEVFEGPEVQYLESASGPVPINTDPAKRIFTVDVMLTDAAPGDEFPFFLADPIAMNLGPGDGGVFSATGFLSLDTGGDAVPDGTRTLYGVDQDVPAPVPPAAFEVDFRDGAEFGVGARIVIDGCYPDCDTGTGSGVLDIFDFLCFQDAFIASEPYACSCAAESTPACTIFDFLCFQDRFLSECE